MASFPHFVVIGAQKSGTTSLCAFLESLDGVALSRPKEPMFFSRDEAALHPHFFAQHADEWFGFDWAARKKTLLEEYAGYFSHAQPDDQCGEGSTSYLLSRHAPKRIYDCNPQCKIIAVLRDPAARAYSAYWHFVKHGISCETFARHLQYEGGHTIAGGEYLPHIQRWIEQFGREQCHFIIYEQLLAQPADVLKKLCAFLGITCPDSASLPKENAGKTPRMLWLQLWLNRTARLFGASHGAFASQSRHWLHATLAPLESWNLTTAAYAPMCESLHHALDTHYKRANDGLETLTGLDTSPYWYATLR